ncbi:hypothetical protein [Cellulomonas sp.]|uniref:hypothetical protein n=1 Tax=Cellulomonas sp. TaxID=40001 RepID=UPI001B004A1B|nr:hypothetical protein [Cellulomonas sp.]MBO9556731.1 hypothetical protein [Cellulomonas sp.]
MSTATTLAAPTPDAVVAMAEERLTRMVARLDPHDSVLRVMAVYERMHAEAVTVERSRAARDAAVDVASADGDLLAMVDATIESRPTTATTPSVEHLAHPVLLANARTELARRAGGAR